MPLQHPPARALPVGASHGQQQRRRRARWALLGGVLLAVLAGALAAGSLPARLDATVDDRPALAPISRPPQLATGGRTAEMIGHGYRLERPAGWQDRTADLSRRFRPIRPDLILSGPVTGGFAATITVITTPNNSRQAPLTRLPQLVAAELARAPRGQVLGATRRATLGGALALTYDFQLHTAGGLLRGRQLVVDYGDDRYFLTVEASPAGVMSTLATFTRLLRGWQWR